MMLTVLAFAVVGLGGGLAWLALTRKRDVSFNVRAFGAQVSLDAKGDSRPRPPKQRDAGSTKQVGR
jgi:hypothetical protein